MSNSELITIAICTYNRARSLRDTLESLHQMTVPVGAEPEVIVVDNNSTDDTESVVEALAARNSLSLRYLFEPKQGLSHARNCAVHAARGAYIIWTDDDVRVDPGWFSAYMRAFKTWPEAAVFGGPIRPRFEGTPPRWLLRALPHVSGAFALRDLGDEPILFAADGPNVPFGANMAVRMREQREHLFDPHLGAGTREGFLGEDTKVARAILSKGLEGRWVPDAIAHHVIPKSRQTTSYLWRWHESYGRTTARMRGSLPGRKIPFFDVPLWLLRAMLVSGMRFMVWRLFNSPEMWCKEMTDLATMSGGLKQRLKEKRRHARSPR